jgi:citrate lyase subunit alpha/citrate CoA-transferase
MSASLYASPHSRSAIADQLDAMLLGAAEIDLDFNVNVTTGTRGMILGGSGGHADTAAGAKLALVATRLASSAGPKIVDTVGCLTTPGATIDAVVTEAGVAVNPRRADLLERLRSAGIEVVGIETLRQRALAAAPGHSPAEAANPQSSEASDAEASDAPIVGVVEYRDGRVIDVIRRTGPAE